MLDDDHYGDYDENWSWPEVIIYTCMALIVIVWLHVDYCFHKLFYKSKR